jgi:hypothetical protein
VLWGEISVQVARNQLTCTLLVQLDTDTEQREVRRGSESLKALELFPLLWYNEYTTFCGSIAAGGFYYVKPIVSHYLLAIHHHGFLLCHFVFCGGR